jgi:hypothetical protein
VCYSAHFDPYSALTYASKQHFIRATTFECYCVCRFLYHRLKMEQIAQGSQTLDAVLHPTRCKVRPEPFSLLALNLIFAQWLCW